MAENDLNTHAEYPDDLAPFAGRQSVLALIKQHIVAAPRPVAFCLSGHEGIGKTRLLQAARIALGSEIISLYLPLADILQANATAWWALLADQTTEALSARGFNTARVPQAPEAIDSDTWYAWLDEAYLPACTALIRSHRHLVWMMDDAAHLADALQSGQLPPSLPADMLGLLTRHSQLSVVLTIDAETENRLDELRPLASSELSNRILPLNLAESIELLEQVAPFADQNQREPIYHATGGQPALLRAYGESIMTEGPGAAINLEAFNQRMLRQNETFFDSRWQMLDINEQIVLRSIAQQNYLEPNSAIMPKDIETWLIDTDTPLDLTTIFASLRGLEFRSLIRQGPEGIEISIGLMQPWILERRRKLTDPVSSASVQRSRRMTVVAWAAILLMALLLILFAAQTPVAPDSDPAPPPTLTLMGGDG